MNYEVLALKRKKSQIITVLFFVFSTLNLVGEALMNSVLISVSKPMIMISLSALFFVWTRKRIKRFSIFILIALFFSLLGDIILLFGSVNETYFKLGLLSFLITQVFYICAFTNNFLHSRNPGNPIVNLISLGFFGTLYYFILTTLSEFVEGDFALIAIYGAAISLMGITASWRFNKVELISFVLCFLGSLLFIFSDSLIAYNHFVLNDESPVAIRLGIMLTYIVAQYLIVIGAIEHIKWVRPSQNRKF